MNKQNNKLVSSMKSTIATHLTPSAAVDQPPESREQAVYTPQHHTSKVDNLGQQQRRTTTGFNGNHESQGITVARKQLRSQQQKHY